MRHHVLARAAMLAVLIAATATLTLLRPPQNARGQTPSGTVVVNQLDATGYPEMRAVVTVLTSDGVPAVGLAPAAFAVAGDDAAIVSVSSAQDASLGLGVVLLIDTSGSMQGAPIAAARQAALQFITQLGPNDEASIIEFSDSVRVVTPFTSDRATLDAGIAGLDAVGPTALYEALQAAAFAARSSSLPRQAILLLSDGKNEAPGSPATAADSIAAVRGARVPVFTVGYGADADVAYLRQVATESSGAAYLADQFDVATTYAGIGELLRSQYVLTLRAPAPADGTDAALRVSATVDGQVVTSDPVPFVRGTAPAVVLPTAVVPPPSTAPVAAAEGGGSDAAPVIAIVAVAAVCALVVLALLSRVLRGVMRARAQRSRDRHAGQVSDEALPEQPSAPLAAAAEGPEPTAMLQVTNGDGRVREFRVGGAPLLIGTDELADIRLDDTSRVARRQATVWCGGGHLRLRHVGGTRPTLVDGRPVDVIILEPGDEFTVGNARFRVGDETAGG